MTGFRIRVTGLVGTLVALAAVVGNSKSFSAPRSFRFPQAVHITLLSDFHRGVETDTERTRFGIYPL